MKNVLFLNHSAIAIVAMLIMSYSDGFAQIFEYGYQNTLEFGVGGCFDLHKYSEFQDNGVGLFSRGWDNGGVDLNLRYTRFFGNQWGAYLEMGTSILKSGAGEVDAALNKNRKTSDQYTYYGFDPCCGDSYGSVYSHMMIGPAYRYDFGRWSLRGRLGLGYTKFHNDGTEYYREKNGEYQMISIRVSDKKGDRIYDYYKRCFSAKPSVQLTFTPRRHMFFALEVSYLATFMRENFCSRLYNLELENIPDPEVDAPYWFYDPYISSAELVSHEIHRTKIGNPLSVRFGIGWNIGWNRNAR